MVHITRRAGSVFALVAALVCSGTVAATADSAAVVQEPIEVASVADATLVFDPAVPVAQSTTYELPDGSTLTLGAEPAPGATRAALSGTWTIWGDNGLARMEYKMDLAKINTSLTKITKLHSLKVTGRLTSFSGEKLTTVRASETASLPAKAQGYAKFSYLDNGWITVWTQSGGVAAEVKSGKVTTYLY